MLSSRSLTSRSVLAVAVAAVALILAGCETPPSERDAAIGHINNSRAQAGRGALNMNTWLSERAEASSVRMRDAWVNAGCPSRTPYLKHTADLVAHYRPERVNSGWSRVGENIGVTGVSGPDRGPAIESLHRAYMASPSHRDNILDSYSYVGVGNVTGPTAAQSAAGKCPGTPVNSVMWNTQAFVK